MNYQVSTSGFKKILFYPNPAKRSQPLKYILEQGVPDCRLKFFDVNGRLILDFESLPDFINISLLPKGMVFYNLMDGEKVLESGKLIIQ